MNISIDYDDTYSTDPQMWSQVVRLMQQAHNVYCVTKRYERLAGDIERDMCQLGVPIIYVLYGQSKEAAAKLASVTIDVWIDDNPGSIMPFGKAVGRHRQWPKRTAQVLKK